jgi:hypothetical protein
MHGMDYLITRIVKEATKGYSDRSEYTPPPYKVRFAKVMRLEKKKSGIKHSLIHLLSASKEHRRVDKIIAEGKKFGLSKMINHLEEKLANPEELSVKKCYSAARLLKELKVRKENAEKKGYTAHFKGNEVLLAPLS